jgi:uncharacterized GH25 family protein
LELRARILPSLALLVAPVALGHEFWIEPSDFRPPVGSVVAARVMVGENFLGEAKLRDDSHILRFEMVGPGGGTPMIGRPGAEPAGLARIPAAGVYLVGYESQPRKVSLEGDKLDQYIREEGLEPFFRGGRPEKIEDRYSRYAKSLLVAGGAAPAARGWEKKLGFALELVPERDPAGIAAGASLPLILLRDGRPLAGAQVSARKRGQPATRLTARSDDHGRVSFQLPEPGVWMVNSVFIRPVPGSADDWESLWASLTFEIPAPASSDLPPPAK